MRPRRSSVAHLLKSRTWQAYIQIKMHVIGRNSILYLPLKWRRFKSSTHEDYAFTTALFHLFDGIVFYCHHRFPSFFFIVSALTTYLSLELCYRNARDSSVLSRETIYSVALLILAQFSRIKVLSRILAQLSLGAPFFQPQAMLRPRRDTRILLRCREELPPRLDRSSNQHKRCRIEVAGVE
jgi:hypothetical protein